MFMLCLHAQKLFNSVLNGRIKPLQVPQTGNLKYSTSNVNNLAFDK